MDNCHAEDDGARREGAADRGSGSTDVDAGTECVHLTTQGACAQLVPSSDVVESMGEERHMVVEVGEFVHNLSDC